MSLSPRKSITLTCGVVLLAMAAVLLLMPTGRALAQNDLDIPGLDEDVQPTKKPMELEVGVSEQRLTLWGLLRSGGWCMWPLGAFSIALVGLCIYNIMELRPSKFCPGDLANTLKERMHYAQVQSAYDTAKEHPSYLGQLFAHGISFIDLRDEETLGRERVEQALHDFSAKTNRRYMLWINYFSILAQASPMLGLLGTVSGMIKAFSTMGREGMGDPSLLAANISEALVTTATGLTIAIPALFCFFVFRNRLAQLAGMCQDMVDEMLIELVVAVNPDMRASELPEGETPA